MLESRTHGLRTRALSATACVLVVGGAVHGGDVNPRLIPADVAAVAHIDVEAFTRSTVGRYILEHSEELDFEGDLADVRDELGIDPLRDIYSITIFGSGESEDDITALLVMSDAIDDALEKAMDLESYDPVEVGGVEIHHWTDDDTYGYVTRSRDGDRRLVVLAGEAQRVADAVRVVRGRRANLRDAMRDGDTSIRELPREAIAFAIAEGLPWLEDHDGPASEIIDRSDRFMAVVRERRGRTNMQVVMSTGSRQDAQDVAAILQGLMALGRLAMHEAPADEREQLNELMRAIKIESRDSDISVSVEFDSEQLIRHLEALEDMEGDRDDDEGHDEDHDEDEDEDDEWDHDRDRDRRDRDRRDRHDDDDWDRG